MYKWKRKENKSIKICNFRVIFKEPCLERGSTKVSVHKGKKKKRNIMFLYHHVKLSILTLNLCSKHSKHGLAEKFPKLFYFCKNSTYCFYLILKPISSLSQVEKRLKWLLVDGVCGETEVNRFPHNCLRHESQRKGH